ncbi:unnamed protein product [Phaedon cochleariae]|uniref:Lipase maturation factor 1/2 C-terminal domain-containing protein n=1 Tax=Phaedon cochleariae TaxID=80249 RepID=A0A9N9SG65_PHACE|nr:unnamed protein product [Phaedon cochleariae]
MHLNRENIVCMLCDVNQYGQMFVKLPSGAGRSEIVFEGANNADGPWSEYSFLYKPGNVNLSLPFVGEYASYCWMMYTLFF